MSLRKPAPFKFKVTRSRAAHPSPVTAVKEETPAQQMGLIQGKQPQSVQEWWVAQGLQRMKMTFHYQYSVFGGHTRGGYFVDFLVDTQPLKTILELYSNHWHTDQLGADDRQRQIEIEQALSDIARVPMSILWADDLIDEDHTYEALRRVLR